MLELSSVGAQTGPSAPASSCLSTCFQGLYENFLNMKLRDSSFSSVCLALEWLGFSDLLSQAVLHGQNFQLMRYLPFLPVAFHLLFAATSIPRLAYPSSQHEASTGEGTVAPSPAGMSVVAAGAEPSLPSPPRPWPS